MAVNGGVVRLVPKVVLVIFVTTTVTAYTTCQTGIVCTNSTHFSMCVIFANGSISLRNETTSCPPNTKCEVSRCVDLHPTAYNTQSSRRCSIYGFTCVNSYEYQLCSYDQYGYSYTWGRYYQCPVSTVCNESYAYHCHAPYTPAYQPSAIGFVPPQQQPQPPPPPPPQNQQPPPPRQDDCKSKSFVCVDSKSYLLCRDVGDGTFRPYSQQYHCPGSQICHKSFDKPCAVERSGGGSVYSQKWEVFAVLVFLQVVYYRCIRFY